VVKEKSRKTSSWEFSLFQEACGVIGFSILKTARFMGRRGWSLDRPFVLVGFAAPNFPPTLLISSIRNERNRSSRPP